MSFVPSANTGVGDIASALRQMVEEMLKSAFIVSPRFQDYKIEAVDITTADFADIIDEAIQVSVIRHMEDQGIIAGGGTAGDILPSEGGLTESQAVSLGRGAVSRLQNPQQLVSEGLQFLPHATLVGFVITLMPIIINELTKPGGPFDLRFKRRVAEEFNALQDRQTIYDLRIGRRGLIIQAGGGFINRGQNGATSTNTLRMIRDGGINKEYLNQIDYQDHAQGLF